MDNTALRGPWFASMEWLERAWLPQAMQLGLRYVAHVVQTATRSDILTLNYPTPSASTVEIQFFDDVAAAEHWLHSCQLPIKNPARPRFPFP